MGVTDRIRASRRRWLLLPLLCAVPLFFVGGPDWLAPPVYRSAWSQGHMLFFALFTLWLGGFVRLEKPRRWVLVSVVVFIASVVIEAIQSQVGREASWNDVLRNLIGTWLGLFWPLRPDWRVWLGRILASLLLLWQLSGFGGELWNHSHRIQQFPVLSDFESARDLSSWTGNIERVSEPVTQGRHSLAIRLGTERFSGAELVHLRGDWRAYQTLRFSLYSPGADELALTLRINDEQHDRRGSRFADRFNHRLRVRPGWNHYRIDLKQVRRAPEDRSMDMARIQHLGIFASELPEPQQIYLDYLRVE